MPRSDEVMPILINFAVGVLVGIGVMALFFN